MTLKCLLRDQCVFLLYDMAFNIIFALYLPLPDPFFILLFLRGEDVEWKERRISNVLEYSVIAAQQNCMVSGILSMLCCNYI